MKSPNIYFIAVDNRQINNANAMLCRIFVIFLATFYFRNSTSLRYKYLRCRINYLLSTGFNVVCEICVGKML